MRPKITQNCRSSDLCARLCDAFNMYFSIKLESWLEGTRLGIQKLLVKTCQLFSKISRKWFTLELWKAARVQNSPLQIRNKGESSYAVGLYMY